MLKESIKSHSFKGNFDKDVNQAFSKFMIEAAGYCSTDIWRADIVDHFGDSVEYAFNFSSGGAVSDSEIEEAKNGEILHVVYHEVFMNDEDGMPDIKRHIADIVFVAKESDGTPNKAVANSLYRSFAAMYFKALDQFPTKYIKDTCYIGKEPILF